MFHIIWYVIIGLLSGFIAKSVMHEHLTMFWTLVLGVIGSILGGGLAHILSRSKNERYHPAGLIFSTLGAILVLFVCYKLKIHLPQSFGLIFPGFLRRGLARTQVFLGDARRCESGENSGPILS